MGAIRNVMVQYGMMQAWVSVLKATDERNKVSLNQTHNCCDAAGKALGVLHPIKQKVVCSGCGKDLQTGEITKAYQPAKGTYMEVTQAELDSIKVASNGAIIINEVVKPDLILENPTLFTGQTYFLTPPSKEKYPPMAYAVIMESLRGDFGLARTSMYNREYTCLIRVGVNGLVMDLIRYPGEMRAEPVIALPRVDPSYIALAKQFKEGIRAQQPTLNYPDLYNEGFAQMIAAKLAGSPLASTPTVAPQPMAPDSIKAMLEAMLAAQAATKAAPPAQEAPAPVEEPAKPAAKGKAKGKGKRVA